MAVGRPPQSDGGLDAEGARRDRRRAWELDQLAREVVRLRLARSLESGQWLKVAEIAELARECGLDVRSPAGQEAKDAHALFARAFRNRLVEIEVRDSPRPATPSAEDTALSSAVTAKLREHYGTAARWFDFRAVKVKYSTGATEQADVQKLDDERHRHLGWWAGCVWLSGEAAAGDRVAVSAGRGAVGTMNGLLSTRGLAGLSLYALSGCSERGFGALPGRSLDADSVVRHAVASWTRADDSPVKARYTTLPVALPAETLERANAEDGLLRLIAGYLLDDWWEGDKRPQVAVLGFAALGPERGNPLLLTRNKYIRKDIADLCLLAEQHSTDGLAVGEVAHCLWLACDQSTPGYEAAAPIVDRLNQKLVAPTLRGLKSARKRLLVGGGETKVSILHSLLRDVFAGTPTVVVTDSPTAAGLLDQLS